MSSTEQSSERAEEGDDDTTVPASNHLHNTVQFVDDNITKCAPENLFSIHLTTEFLSVHLLLLLQTKLCLIVYHCIGVTVIIGKKGMTFYIAVIGANCPSQCMISDQSIFTQPRTITWFRCVICPQPTPKVMCAICNSSVCVLDWKYQTKYFQSSKANDLELRR